MKQNLYPHVFQPITIRGLTLKNRLEYAPTVVLKCNADGTMSQDMLDFMEWQAKTGVGWVTVGDTPVTHDNTSHWLCEMNVCDDDCIHGMNALVEQCRRNGAELSVELAYAGRGNRAPADGAPTAVVSAERPLAPGDNVRTMDKADMEYIKGRYVDCAVRCKHAGFRMILLHCAHNNFLAQWLSPDSNVRTDENGGSPENRRRFPLEVLREVRQAVGEDMVIELRVSATEGIPGGLEFDESLEFMKLAQEYVDIMHVSQGSIFHLSARYTIPTYFRTPHQPLNVGYAAKVKEALHIPVAVVGMITTLEEAEQIIASGQADIVAMAKSHMADGELVKKTLAGHPEQVRPCTRCDLCGNANTWGTAMSCAVNPRCGISGDIVPVPPEERKRVMVIGGGPAGMMAAQTLTARGHQATLYEKSDKLGGLLNDACLVPFKGLMREYVDWDIRATYACGARVVLNTEVTEALVEEADPDAIIVATGSVYVNPPIPGLDSALAVREVDGHQVETGKNVVVCGGGITGLECALALCQEGKQVTVVDQLPTEQFVSEMPIFNKADLLAQLEEGGVILQGSQTITSVDGGVHTVDSQGEEHFFPADSVVNALGVKPEDKLGKALLTKYGSVDVIMVGDCTATGGNYYRANHEAYDAAMRI
jgi:2,4-dienoyl-CoA reductase-like NADH-dependent reductase (Old Yellow Enzyme family)/NADPH-dependent 2,4-dienoyl-CoA reductase/sulfur reductase-like enzyme